MKHILETERLFLRKLELSDTSELFNILGDEESMRYYPRAFTKNEVENWVRRNIRSYEENNFGLWAVILKSDNLFIGDCGITIQNIEGRLLPELGYHINKHHCNKGYASEASAACMKYASEELGLKKLYTYTDVRNIPSICVAKNNGMSYVKSFKKKVLDELIDEVLYSINL